MDLATTFGPVALRLDAAYQTKRVFMRRDLAGSSSPTLQAVLTAEYQTGDKRKLAVLEVLYTHLFDRQSVPLLIYERNTVGLVADLRWPIWHALGFELRGLLGMRPKTAIVQPELDLRFEHWVVSLGALWLGGEAYSLGRYFDRNAEAYTKLKVLF